MSKQKKIIWSIAPRKLIDLIKNGYNPRKLNESEKRDLEKSINKFGTVVPVVLNIGTRTNVIIGGKQRIKIYADLGIEEIECMIPSRELTLEEEKELNLRLNKNTGSWSEELLKEFDMNMLLDVGFGDEELQNLFDDVDLVEDDFDMNKAIKETKVSKVKLGEVWQMGKHMLLVGDSTNEAQVATMMEGTKCDFIYLDPPYNVGVSYNKGMGGKSEYGGEYTSKDDSKTEIEYENFIENSIKTALIFSKPDCHVYTWCDPNNISMVQNLYTKVGIKKRRVCLWVKGNQNCTPKVAWNRIYEPVIYGTLGSPYLNQNIKNGTEIFNQEVTTGNQILDEVQDMFDLWLVKRDSTSEYLHPTQKPVTLNEKPLKRCSAPLHVVFSGFGGSGSDLIACEELGRCWRGVEKDLIFATIIIDRWEKFTNLKAKKIYENK